MLDLVRGGLVEGFCLMGEIYGKDLLEWLVCLYDFSK